MEKRRSSAWVGFLILGGLIVGIIAYFAYNILVSNVEKVVFKMEATTSEFMDLLNEPV